MRQKSVLVIGGFYFILLLCLIKTDNSPEAWNTLIIKLPILYAPFIFATSSPLSGKAQRLVLNVFILATLITTLISIGYLFTHEVYNLRELSLFISHIRFSLCIVLSICFSFYFAFSLNVYAKSIKAAYLIVILWMVSYLFIVQTLTGIVTLYIILFFVLLYLLFHFRNKTYRRLALILSLLMVSVSGYVIYLIFDYSHADEIELSSLPQVTINGNPYSHDLNSVVEHGGHIGLYVSVEELRNEWMKRSDAPYDEMLEATLIRYLNSKGLTKDSAGMQQLTSKDIGYIELGIANGDYVRGFGLKRSLYPILFSISIRKVEHSTILQRVELWRIAIAVIKKNFWTGVGLGDAKNAIDQEVIEQHSPMIYKKNMGCHNQFLSCFVMGGIFLFLYFIYTLFYPFFAMKKKITLLYITFFILIFCSFFTEDTLGTQAGVTLYAFFNAFLLYVFNEKTVAISKRN